MADTKINVVELDDVTSIEDDDTLLLIRKKTDGTREAKRIDAGTFKGEDAYAVAVEKGYTGTYADWQLLVEEIVEASDTLANIAEVNVDFDADAGEIIVSVG